MNKPAGPEPKPEDPYVERRGLTFEQAEGAEPLPAQLQLKEHSPLFRAAIWKLVLDGINSDSHSGTFDHYLDGQWRQIMFDRHVYRLHRPADEFSGKTNKVVAEAKKLIMQGTYDQVLGFLQFVIRHRSCPHRFAEAVGRILAGANMAYRLAGDTIVPFGSEAEAASLQRAFADLASTEFHGARKHLRTAAEYLTEGKASDSIRESIHAVESVVRVLEPKGDFAKALARLDEKVKIHGALKSGFSSLYGFTNDEKGIRHPLLDNPTAKVDEADALFMIGACGSFVSYLINKARTAGLLAKK